MKQYLLSFFKDFEYEEKDSSFLLKVYDLILENSQAKTEWDVLLSVYNENIACDYAALREGARKVGTMIKVHPYTMELLLYICFSKRTKEVYIERGLDLGIYHNSMLDLKFKLDECKEILGICGSFVCSWFSRFFDLTRFALGRLQFELEDCGFDYEKDGKVIKKGEKAINIHIPRTGTPMDEAACDEAFAMAKEFFKADFSGRDTAFICHSWLLYPAHEEILKPTTNTRKFMSRFDIIDSGDYETYAELWRLFDRRYSGNPDDLPYDSSFRRAYVDRIKAGGKTGWGAGIFFYD